MITESLARKIIQLYYLTDRPLGLINLGIAIPLGDIKKVLSSREYSELRTEILESRVEEMTGLIMKLKGDSTRLEFGEYINKAFYEDRKKFSSLKKEFNLTDQQLYVILGGRKKVNKFTTELENSVVESYFVRRLKASEVSKETLVPLDRVRNIVASRTAIISSECFKKSGLDYLKFRELRKVRYK